MDQHHIKTVISEVQIDRDGSMELKPKQPECPRCNTPLGAPVSVPILATGDHLAFACPSCGYTMQQVSLDTKTFKIDIADNEKNAKSIFKIVYPGSEEASWLKSATVHANRHYEVQALIQDDRAAALVAAMYVEDAVNAFLGAVMPGFEELTKDNNFTFSLRIATARALQLCSDRFFDDADKIRKVRNAFAHTGEVESFDDAFAAVAKNLDAKSTTDSFRARLKKYTADSEPADSRSLFMKLVQCVAIALFGYAKQNHCVIEFMRTRQFQAAISNHSVRKKTASTPIDLGNATAAT